MTDEQIIKALECCATAPSAGEFAKCKGCPLDYLGTSDCFDFIIQRNALDLINRRNAEIERLIDLINEVGEYNEAWVKDNHDLRVELKTAKSDAIREFAERLKATPYRFREERTIYFDKPPITKMVLFVDDNDIDNLVKEMTEETP